jgi:hypothetical protein
MRKEETTNPWDRVRTYRGKLVGMLNDKLAKNVIMYTKHKPESQSGLNVVHLPKTNRKK